ncbi:hypothetical protein [Streptomyces tsukubensis]|uniref:hypothetical protein n=1 Tax=Streptomyces tsukubensis TaxID=83656 RepID=UPI00344C7A3C
MNFTNFDVSSMPDIRSSDVTLIQRDGLWAGDDYIGGRTVNLSLEVQALDADEFGAAVNLVMRAFSPGVSGETQLRFRIPGLANGREAYVKARTRKRSNPLDASFARLSCAFEIELFATDPLIYAGEETSVTLRKGIPTLVPIDGSRAAKPSIAFTNVVNPKLLDAEDGKTTFSHTGTGTFTVSGPNYTPGNRYITLTDSGPNVNATAVLKFRDTWV